jgi:predicted ATPase/class 3 adenylate cyclase
VNTEGGLPTGTVTFLFTDLEGSTRLWEEHPEAMKAALARHDEILREAVETQGGVVVKTTGDGLHAAFGSAEAALSAAAAAQRALAGERWEETGPLRVRMGIHTGAGELRDGDYFGPALNRAARLTAVAHGGQVLVSLATEELVRDSLNDESGLVELGEHRLRDLSRPERVFQLQAPGLASEFPALQSLDALPGNLPVQLTSFVGRDEELARVARELSQARVVTLTGVGGVGKTRLALEVAAEVVPEFRDGSWLVELAGVRDPEGVPDAVVAVFGLQPGGGRSATETVLEFLGGKALLLVLDNCEHLLRPVADLVGEVVRACPGVRVLATSREGLNVAGEQILAVASLEVPNEAGDLDAVARAESVILFVDRARSVKAGFALDASNVAAVAQVCRRLDGIALAVELAAARVAMLTPTELAQRLDRRFRLLAGGQRGVVERHQTLRAAIDWSYALLSEAEQLLLARLSVFVGGFSLDAAEAVAADDDVEADEIFELLSGLVARSLASADTEGVETRYRLLETIRQYAQEHLDNTGDGVRLRAAHAAYYAGFGETAIANTAGPHGIDWQRRLERELDNIGAALTWAIETQDADTAVRLFGMWSAPTIQTDVNFTGTLRWAADTVVDMPGASEHLNYPAALGVTAAIAWAQADQDLAARRCDEALAAERRLGTEPSILIWLVRGNVALAQGHADEAREHARRAVELSRARGEPAWLAWSLSLFALTHAMQGDAVNALPAAEEVITLTHRMSNPHIVENALAMAAFALGDSDPERALALAREALALARMGANSPSWAIAGDLAARRGRYEEALQYMAKAIDTFHWLGNRTALATVIGRVGDLLADTDPEAAAVLQGAGDALAPGYAHAPHSLEARHHAIAIEDASLGGACRRELHDQGASMTDDEAATYAQAAITRSLGDGSP